MMMAPAPTRTYMYAITRPIGTVDVSGIEGAGVRVLEVHGVAAVVSTVDAALFDPATMQTRLADLGWVEPIARAHDGVVTAAAAVTTTIPLRLGTTAVDDTSVRELLADLAPAAHRSLERLENRSEYGVQIFDVQQEVRRSAGPAEGGAAFLRRRRAELAQDETRRALAAHQVCAAFDTLSDLAVASRQNPLRVGGLGTSAPMLLNATYLVDDSGLARFRAAVDELAADLGRDRVVITGPWAPYSFAELEL